MTTLHTISDSWHDATWLFENLVFAKKGDAVLLIQDAVLAAQSPILLASFLAKCDIRGVEVYALRDDCTIRGIDNQQSKLRLVDYAEFVGLVEKHDKQLSW